MMNKCSIVLMCCLLPSFSAFAQQRTSEASLSEAIAQLRQYASADADSAAHYAALIEKQIPQVRPEQQLAAYSALGLAARSAARHEAAGGYFQQAGALAARLNEPGEAVRQMVRQGNALTMQGKTAEAVKLHETALALASQADSLAKDRMFALQSLAFAYQKGRDPARSIPHLQEVLAYYQAQQHWAGIINTHNLLHIAWSEIDSLDRAYSHLERLLLPPLSEHLTLADSGMVFNNLGRLHNMMGQHERAAQLLAQAVAVKQQQNNPESLAKTLVEQMTSLKLAQRWTECTQLAAKLDTADLQRLSIYTRRDWYMQLSECYAGDGRMQQAYATRLQYEALYDSTFALANREAIREVELRLAEQEREGLRQGEQLARKQRNLAIAGIGGLILAGLLFFSLWRSRKQRQAAVLAVKAEAIQENNELQKRLFTNIAHELRTPLTLITAPLQLMEANPKAPEAPKRLITMRQGVAQLLRLVNQILDLSRLEAGRLPVALQPVQVRPFFSRLLAGVQSAAEVRGIELALVNELPEGTCLALDAPKVEQIVNNLLSNALKFTPKSGSISLRLAQSQAELLIAVTDSGPGIPEAALDRIFDRFYSVQPQGGSQAGGAGIGLPFSRELATLMGGTLQAESKAGQGSTFVCRLPWQPAAPPPSPILPDPVPDQAATPVPSISGQAKATLLLVEDQPDMHAFIRELLSEQYLVRSAFDGQEALLALEAHPDIDLVISDVMMPRMDGFALLTAIKQNEQWLGLPVILLTARAEAEDQLRALAIGVDDYLTKPFNSPELLARVANLLAFRRLRQGLAAADEPSPPPDISAADWAWLKKVEAIMLDEIRDTQFGIAMLAQALHLSERQLHRRIKSITGMTPNRYFWEIRLRQASQLLEAGTYSTVSEVSYAVGIATPAYFSRKYEERFGKAPSAYFS